MTVYRFWLYYRNKEDANPYLAKPFPKQKIQKPTLKKEVDRLIKIGVLKKLNNSQRAAPTFIIPKKDAWCSKIYSEISFFFSLRALWRTCSTSLRMVDALAPLSNYIFIVRPLEFQFASVALRLIWEFINFDRVEPEIKLFQKL